MDSTDRPLVLSFYKRTERADARRLMDLIQAQAVIASHDRLTRKLESYGRRRRAELKLAESILDNPVISELEPDLEVTLNRMKGCRQHGVVGHRADGRPVIAWKQKCDCLRLCPDEARQDQSRVIKQYFDAFMGGIAGGLRIYKAVFTMPNVPRGELHAGKRAIFREFTAWREHFPEVMGALAIEEDPYSSRGDWNVHLNVLLLVNGFLDYGDKGKVQLYWPVGHAEGAGWVVHVDDKKSMLKKTRDKLARRGLPASKLTDDIVLVEAVKECIKYPVQAVSDKSTKAGAGGWVAGRYQDARGKVKAPPMTEWGSGAQLEWIRAQRGFRRVRSYGLLYSIPRPKLPDGLDQDTTWWGRINYLGRDYGYELLIMWAADRRTLLPLIPRGITFPGGGRDKPYNSTTGPPPTLEERALALCMSADQAYHGENYGSWLEQRRAEELTRAIYTHLEDAA